MVSSKQFLVEDCLYTIGFVLIVAGLMTPATLAAEPAGAHVGETAATGNVLHPIGFHAMKIIAPRDFRLRYPRTAVLPEQPVDTDVDTSPESNQFEDSEAAHDVEASASGALDTIASFDLVVCAVILCSVVVCILVSALWAKFKSKADDAMSTCVARTFNLLMLVACFTMLVVPLSLVEARDVETDLRDGYIPLLLFEVPLLAVFCAIVTDGLESSNPRQFYLQIAFAAAAASCIGATLWFGRDEQLLWVEPQALAARSASQH